MVTPDKKETNYAYIDWANLDKGVASLGWPLDYVRFRVWLTEKYHVDKAYLFIGFISRYYYRYKYLEKIGFILVFKEVVYDALGKAKGNCDADLVLHATKDVFEGKNDKSIIVSSDGDYTSLINFLQERDKLLVVLSPHTKETHSILLKRTNTPVTYLNDVRSFLEMQNEKAPDGDRTP
jgi:uncharacterized LabA/DUF88 family protein